MKAIQPAIILASLIIACASAAHAVTAIFERTPCANGFENAFTVTSIDQWGCVISVHGVNCNGVQFAFEGGAQPRPTDLGLSYDVYHTGEIDGHTWYAKIKRDAAGGVATVWGQRADGAFYEIVPVP